MSRIISGRIKKKAGKKCVYNPADLEVALPETRQPENTISQGPPYSFN
jgi:hypothetical protein